MGDDELDRVHRGFRKDGDGCDQISEEVTVCFAEDSVQYVDGVLVGMKVEGHNKEM